MGICSSSEEERLAEEATKNTAVAAAPMTPITVASSGASGLSLHKFNSVETDMYQLSLPQWQADLISGAEYDNGDYERVDHPSAGTGIVNRSQSFQQKDHGHSVDGRQPRRQAMLSHLERARSFAYMLNVSE